jgi:hypothetical protein
MSFRQKTIPDRTELDCYRNMKMAIGKAPGA